MTSYLRKTFLLCDPLPVQKLSEDKLTDGTMPLTPQEARAATNNLEFPSSFLWGAATAAYQIEGGLHNCNWSLWEQQATRAADGHSTVENNEKAGKACNSWELLGQDLKAMKKLGLKMYRFSVEWSRIEPVCGEFNEEALQRYTQWCQQLKQAGIEPMVTLHHFTEPAWFVEKGGWENRGNLQYFERFVGLVTQSLAPHCRYWTTINELNGYAICGWVAGVHPPGRVNDFIAMLRVVRHLLVAHTMASRAIRASSAMLPDNPIICQALSHVYFLPAQSSSARPQTLLALIGWFLNRFLSTVVSLFLNYVFNFVLLDAIFHKGRFPNFPFPFQLVASLAGWGSDVKALQGTCDWIGVNHYYRSYVQFGRARDTTTSDQKVSPTDMFIALPLRLELRAAAIPNFEKNEMGWDLTPSSMIRLLEIFADRYPTIPMIITESGTADTTDHLRVRYIASLLQQMHDLLESKRVDLRGYLIWTLLDNFEWAEGFRPKFGLLETNFETFERTERKETCDMLRAVFGKK